MENNWEELIGETFRGNGCEEQLYTLAEVQRDELGDMWVLAQFKDKGRIHVEKGYSSDECIYKIGVLPGNSARWIRLKNCVISKEYTPEEIFWREVRRSGI